MIQVNITLCLEYCKSLLLNLFMSTFPMALYRLYFKSSQSWIISLPSSQLFHGISSNLEWSAKLQMICSLIWSLLSFPLLFIPIHSLWLPWCCKKHAKHTLVLRHLLLLPLPRMTLFKFHLKKSSLIFFNLRAPTASYHLPCPDHSLSPGSCFIFLKLYLLSVFSMRM